MKSRMLLVLAGLLMISMLAISPAYAQGVIYEANGTLDEYIEGTTAEVYRGRWRIRIEGNDVTFRGWYLELNLDEEIPDTLDWFRLRLIPTSEPTIDGGVCTVEGDLVFRKLGWDNEEFGPNLPNYQDLPGPWYTAKFAFEVTITINTDRILNDFHLEPPANALGIEGSTIEISYL